MPKIGANFQFESAQSNFSRDSYATLALMKAVAVIDDGHLAYCAEDGKTYKYLASNSVDETTGRWREFGLTSHNHDDAYAPLSHTHDNYLTEHQDISALALKSEIPDVSGFETIPETFDSLDADVPIKDNAIYNLSVTDDEFIIPAAPTSNVNCVLIYIEAKNDSGLTLDDSNVTDWYGYAPLGTLEKGDRCAITIINGQHGFRRITRNETYHVTFKYYDEEGTLQSDVKSVRYGHTVNAPTSIPDYEDEENTYTFKGWKTLIVNPVKADATYEADYTATAKPTEPTEPTDSDEQTAETV